MSTGKTPRALVGVLACIASLSGLLFGYDASSINDALPLITDHFGLSQTMKGNVVSVLLLGAVVGSMLAGFPADRWGRRPTILMSGVTFCVGCTVSSWLARNVAILILGRFIIGFAIGITSSVSPLYIAELVRAHFRPSHSAEDAFAHASFTAAYRHQRRIAAGW
jgi:MFS family permease